MTVLASSGSNLLHRQTGRTSKAEHINVLETAKIWSWVLIGPETKNDCTGKGKQQITALLKTSRKPRMIVLVNAGSRPD
jgi:hypothetical protein